MQKTNSTFNAPVIIVLIALLAGCGGTAPTMTPASTFSPTAVPAAVVGKANCPQPERAELVAKDFVTKYNSKDIDGVLGLFETTVTYIDASSGLSLQSQPKEDLRAKLKAFMDQGDGFTVGKTSAKAEEGATVTRYNVTMTDLTRVRAGQTQKGQIEFAISCLSLKIVIAAVITN